MTGLLYQFGIVVDDLARFAARVRQETDVDALRNEADLQIERLNETRVTLNLFAEHEGKNLALIRPPEAEILRKPLFPDATFSCEPVFMVGNRRSGTTL